MAAGCGGDDKTIRAEHDSNERGSTSQALLSTPDLSIQDLLVFQTRPQTGVTPQITVSFRVANGGPAVTSTFRTSISGVGTAVNIDTSSIDGKPSIGAGETLYFSKTIPAASTGTFTVQVATDTTHVVAEADEGNNTAVHASSIDAPPVGQWYWVGPTSMSGSTGRLLEVVLGPGDPNTMYTRGEEPACGIWKTTDGGSTWRNISLSLPLPTETALAVAPNDKNRLYAMSQNDGLYMTANGGVTWKRIATSSTILGRGGNPGFVISPKNTKAMFFGGNDGIYRSTNGGYAWTSATAPYLKKVGSDGTAAVPFTVALDPANGDTLYAALMHSDSNAAGLYRTTTATSGPSGDWKKMGQCAGSSLPSSNGAPILFSVVPPVGTTPTTLFVAYSSTPIRLFKSTGTCTNPSGVADLAFTTINVATPPPPPIFAFTVKPTDTSKLFIGGFPGGSSFNFRSTDGGANWTSIATGHADLKSYTWNTTVNPPVLIAASDGGLHTSTDDGDHWTLLSGGVQNAELYHLARIGRDGFPPDNDGDLVAGTQDNGNIRGNRTDTSWNIITGGDGSRLATFRGPPGEIVYGGSQYPQNLQKVLNSNAAVAFGQGLPTGAVCFNGDIKAIHRFAGGADLPRVFVPCQSLFWRDDDGTSTSFASVANVPLAGRGNPIWVNHNTASDALFLGTDTGDVLVGTNATAADPSTGMTWSPLFSLTGLGFAAAPITDIQFDPANTAAFISTNRTTTGRVFKLAYTISSGTATLQSATDVTGNLATGRVVNALAFDEVTFHAFFAATDDGVYKASTPDFTTYNWSELRGGMGRNVNVTALVPWVDGNGFRALAASIYGRSAMATRVEPECTPTISTSSQGKCGSTVNFDGKLYECISQAAGVNGELTGCGSAGVYCSNIPPDYPFWGPQAWQVIDCP